MFSENETKPKLMPIKQEIQNVSDEFIGNIDENLNFSEGNLQIHFIQLIIRIQFEVISNFLLLNHAAEKKVTTDANASATPRTNDKIEWMVQFNGKTRINSRLINELILIWIMIFSWCS